MTEMLFMDDPYLKEFDAIVLDISNGKYIILNKTAFYSRGGGQPSDEGILERAGEIFKVIFARKINDKISHEVDREGLKVGDKIIGKINWERRYKLMRSHTAAHVISAVITKETDALITGNDFDIEKIRVDYNLEEFNKELIQGYIDKVNKILEKDIPVKNYYITREEAMNDKSLFKLAKGFPEYIQKIRITEIEGIDKQADGGTHVKNLKEVGKVELIKVDNKGKNNRRIYCRLVD